MIESPVEHNQTSQIISAFSSIVNPGLILMIGEVAASHYRSALDGMGALSKLVVNLDLETPVTQAESEVALDIRAAVHRQNPQKFLKDVSHHSLNLVVVADDILEPGLCEQIIKMLVEGGCLMVLSTTHAEQSKITISSKFFYRLEFGSWTLFVKKAFQQPKVRRGGRRSRL